MSAGSSVTLQSSEVKATSDAHYDKGLTLETSAIVSSHGVPVWLTTRVFHRTRQRSPPTLVFVRSLSVSAQTRWDRRAACTGLSGGRRRFFNPCASARQKKTQVCRAPTFFRPQLLDIRTHCACHAVPLSPGP